MPVVPITDMTIKNNDLVVVTQGRGIWILDDLTVVQHKDVALAGKNLHVFSVDDSYRLEGGGGRRRRGAAAAEPNTGANPLPGTLINYHLKNVTDSSKVSVTVFDKKGKEIRTFSPTAKDPADKLDFAEGLNQFAWDMNYPPSEGADGMILWNGSIGPTKAAPGKYSARFRYNNDSVDVSFVIKPNPVYQLSEADYDEQVEFLLQVRDKFSDIQKGIKSIRTVRNQIKDLSGRIDAKTNKELKQLADTITKQLTSVEEALYQTKSKSGQDVLNFPIRLNDKISGLYGVASSGQNAPSKQAKEAFAELGGQADVQLAKLKQILDVDLKQLNQLINEKKIPVIGVK
jgi:hypothetical protein